VFSPDKVLVEPRQDKGLLGGMLGVPTSAWGEKPKDHSAAPVRRNWQRAEDIKHIFTHFELRLQVFTAMIDEPIEGQWIDDLSGLPTVFRKTVEAARRLDLETSSRNQAIYSYLQGRNALSACNRQRRDICCARTCRISR